MPIQPNAFDGLLLIVLLVLVIAAVGLAAVHAGDAARWIVKRVRDLFKPRQ